VADGSRGSAMTQNSRIDPFTDSTCSWVTPGNQVRNSFIVAPSWRFPKREHAGSRVVLNTQTPLTFPGTRSTGAGRCAAPHSNLSGARGSRKSLSGAYQR
jgi:hypothetical protein